MTPDTKESPEAVGRMCENCIGAQNDKTGKRWGNCYCYLLRKIEANRKPGDDDPPIPASQEAASEAYCRRTGSHGSVEKNLDRQAFLAGVKWQAEQSAERDFRATEAVVGSKAMFTFSMDPSIPENEIHLRLNGRIVGKIINVAAPEKAGEKPATEKGTTCKDCGIETKSGAGSARCPSCWDDKCGDAT